MGMMRDNKFLIFGLASVLLVALAISSGCSDPGSYDDTNTIIPGRVEVYASATAPAMDDPADEVWDNTRIGAIVVGEDSSYTAFFGQKTVNLQAIVAKGRLYLRAEWNDPSRSIRPNEITHSNDTTFDTITSVPLEVDTLVEVWWTRQPSLVALLDTVAIFCDSLIDTGCVHGDSIGFTIIPNIDPDVNAVVTQHDQDRFAILWDAGDNGDYATGGEGADCRTMCHSVDAPSALNHRMYTTGGGHVDVWHWQAGTTDPALLARDEYWSNQGREVDGHTQLIADTNWVVFQGLPRYAHRDTSSFTGSTLHAEDKIDFSETVDYPNGYDMPGYVINDAVFGSGSSLADVSAFSNYNRNIYGPTWVVIMSRALGTGQVDDIDFSTIAPGDSVLATIIVANSGSWLHSGSLPFYIVFP